MGLKVIGSGFGRTGTASLKVALEQLGFGPTHHMEEIIRDPSQVPHWQAAAQGRTIDWDAAFEGYVSQCDWPGAHWWREIAAHYPDAKMILSVRPEAAWWKSFSATIGMMMNSFRQAPVPPHVRDMMLAMEATVMRDTFGGNWGDEQIALAAYRRRIAEVKAEMPAERLLVFDVAQGWEPLCAFLGVPVPAAPFPKVNSTEEFLQALRGGGRPGGAPH